MKFTRMAMIFAFGIAGSTGEIAFAQSVQNRTLDEILRMTMVEMHLTEATTTRVEVPVLNPNIFGKFIPPSRPSKDAVATPPSTSATTLAHRASGGEKKAERKAGASTKDR
jgi:hypothetical protein